MQLWYDYIMCNNCGSKLTPIVYGVLNPDILEMARSGHVIVGDSDAIDRPEFYCSTCTEAF
jgi:hypothetical protein